MNFSADSLGFMKCNKPVSFWVGKDSVYAVAHSPDGLSDSCFFRFRSDSVPPGCSGTSIMISILDTVTSRDYIVWTSSPHDPSISDTTIYNPTASPKVTTKYKVKVYNLLGIYSGTALRSNGIQYLCRAFSKIPLFAGGVRSFLLPMEGIPSIGVPEIRLPR